MLARRLEDRVNTVERIIAADNPDWKRSIAASAADLPDRSEELRCPPAAPNFYLDKQNAKWKGVCAGIADYTGIEVIWVRVADGPAHLRRVASRGR